MEDCRWDGPVNGTGTVLRSTIQGVFRDDSGGAAASLGLSSLAYKQGAAFVIVEATNDEDVNGQNLIAAYAAATNISPHGMARSATNRMTVIVPPGRYNLQSNAVEMSQAFVDLVGLSSACEEQYIFGTSSGLGSGVLEQTANDVRIENLSVTCTRSSGDMAPGSSIPAAYFPASGRPATVVRNCRFLATSYGFAQATRSGIDYAGTYERCTGGDHSFGGDGGSASGTFADCTGGEWSFGGGAGGGGALGRFTDCVGASFSFGGGGGTASGTFTGCVGGNFTFGGSGGIASGTFTRCVGGRKSFGGTASGTFRNCWMNGELWDGDFRGRMEGCRWDAPISGVGTVLCSTVEGVFRDDSGGVVASLGTGSITHGHLDTDAVDSSNIDDGSVTTDDLDLTSVDGRYVKKSGDTMSGALNLPNNGLVVGTDRLVVSMGKVGIGTPTPAEMLEVSGSAKVSGTLHVSANSQYVVSPMGMVADTNANVRFNCSRNGVMSIENLGGAGSYHRVYIPMDLPANLHGTPQKLKSMTLWYRMDFVGGSSEYIADTAVGQTQTDGSTYELLRDFGNYRSTTWSPITVTAATPQPIEGPTHVSLYLRLYGTGTDREVSIGRIVLTVGP